MSAKQAVMLILLMGGSGAVWVPQIRARLNREAPSEASVSPEFDVPDAELEIEPGMPGSEVSTMESAPMPEPASAMPEGPPDDRAIERDLSPSAGRSPEGGSKLSTASLESLLGSMRSFRPELAVTFEGASEFTSFGGNAQTVLPRSMLRAGLEELLVPYPLTGILIAPSGKRAVLGARVFSEGDSPEPGAVIERIDARAVWFKYGGESLRVDLPALQVRGKRSSGNDELPGNSEPGPSGESESLPTDGVSND